MWFYWKCIAFEMHPDTRRYQLALFGVSIESFERQTAPLNAYALWITTFFSKCRHQKTKREAASTVSEDEEKYSEQDALFRFPIPPPCPHLKKRSFFCVSIAATKSHKSDQWEERPNLWCKRELFNRISFMRSSQSLCHGFSTTIKSICAWRCKLHHTVRSDADITKMKSDLKKEKTNPQMFLLSC